MILPVRGATATERSCQACPTLTLEGVKELKRYRDRYRDRYRVSFRCLSWCFSCCIL